MHWMARTFWMAAAATACAQSSVPGRKPALRSGEVIVCELGKGCTQEMVGGRRVLSFEVDGLTVKASLDQEKQRSFADLTISNGTEAKLEVNPNDFRVEVDDLKFKRLSYIDPEGHRHLHPQPLEEESGHGLPPPEYWTSEEHQRYKETRVEGDAGKVKLLDAGPLAAHATVAGRVYFERPPGTRDMSLILPFKGLILEFPFAKIDGTARKKGRKSAVADATT